MNTITKFKDILIETLKENKKMIIIFYVALIVIAILVAIFTKSLVTERLHALSSIQTTTVPNMGETNADALSLFIHNEIGSIQTYITSIFFGISALITITFNGYTTGMYYNLFQTIVPNGGLRYVVYLIPHGIFEYTATVLESVAGVILFKFVWNFLRNINKQEENGFKNKLYASFNQHKDILIQSICLMIFVTILLLIAAPIESYVSIPISNMIVGT